MALIKWPRICDADVAAVTAVLRSGILIKGPVSIELEARFAQYLGIRYCRAVSSCTHALHLALRAIGIGAGDEILVPNLTYCGTVSPVVNCGATPVFVDVDPVHFNISPSDAAAKRTTRTKAVIPVHLHGYPCNITSLRNALPGLTIVEDACQAPGAKREDQYAGTLGDLACFSLNQVKPLCGGQGGLIVTDSPDLWGVISDLASPGRRSTVGLSYEITELSAAIARVQLDKLDPVIAQAHENYLCFKNALRPDLRDIVPHCEDSVRPTWHKLRIRVSAPILEILLQSLALIPTDPHESNTDHRFRAYLSGSGPSGR